MCDLPAVIWILTGIHGDRSSLNRLLVPCWSAAKTGILYFRVVKTYSPLLLTCSLLTSPQHCSSWCLSHACPLSPGLARVLCSTFSGVISSDPNAFSLPTTTSHIPYWDYKGTPGFKSRLHKSEENLRPAVTEPSLAHSHQAAFHSVCVVPCWLWSSGKVASSRNAQQEAPLLSVCGVIYLGSHLWGVVRTIKSDLPRATFLSFLPLFWKKYSILPPFLWELILCHSLSQWEKVMSQGFYDITRTWRF